jgi:hypothetical protein
MNKLFEAFWGRKFFHILSRCCWLLFTLIKWFFISCFIAGVADTGDKLSLVLLLPAINYYYYFKKRWEKAGPESIVTYLLLYVPFVDGVLGMRYIGSMKDVVWSIALLIIIQLTTQETLETKFSVSFLITVGLWNISGPKENCRFFSSY